jgi:hypothetical protein
MQRHEIWRRVDNDYTQAQERAPKGHEAFVQVLLAGREPMVVGFVETRPAADEIWIRFEAATPIGDEDTIPAECYWVHAPENSILGIEIRYRRARYREATATPIGFRVEERVE